MTSGTFHLEPREERNESPRTLCLNARNIAMRLRAQVELVLYSADVGIAGQGDGLLVYEVGVGEKALKKEKEKKSAVNFKE